MNNSGWIGVVLISSLLASPAGAKGKIKQSADQGDCATLSCDSGPGPKKERPPHKTDLERINQQLRGRLVDHTSNNGYDRRIWSRSLFQKRDLYVYLPPGFDPNQRYPLVMWLHGYGMDEQAFANQVVLMVDKAICAGSLPPLIVAAPDGSFKGEPLPFSAGSFFLNTMAGDFQDFVLQDVWDFVVTRYPIRPERQAHIIAGSSMGGFAAFNLGIKHRECFGIVIGVHPPLNLRWMNSKGRYFANFNPKDWGWRTKVDHGREVIARFYGGLVKVQIRQVVDPLFGRGPDAITEVARENPIEMIDRYGLKEGELSMYIAYGGKDEFNVDAQVESFLYLARHRGICVGVGYDPMGRHNIETAQKLFPGLLNWLCPQVAPYSPPLCLECPCCPDCNSSPACASPAYVAPPPCSNGDCWSKKPLLGRRAGK